jgi:DNA-binding transcriptional LysR family regulator
VHCGHQFQPAGRQGLEPRIFSFNILKPELETRRLHILDVRDFPIMRLWYVLQRKGKHLSPAAQAFKEVVLKQAEQFIRCRNSSNGFCFV